MPQHDAVTPTAHYCKSSYIQGPIKQVKYVHVSNLCLIPQVFGLQKHSLFLQNDVNLHTIEQQNTKTTVVLMRMLRHRILPRS